MIYRPLTRDGSHQFATRVFSLISLRSLASVVAGVAAATRSNKWWWDNLAGPDSSNFVASDQIKKTNVSQLDVAWFYPYATPGSTRSSSTM